MAMKDREFFFNGMPVGCFLEAEFPRIAARYPYMPYRGPGHYEMQLRLHAGECPRCHYEDGGVRTSFIVGGCPDYGFLDLRDFEQ